MEQLLFYQYLDFQRQQFSDLGKKVKCIPIYIRLLFCTAIISIGICIGSLLFCKNRLVGYIATVSELICAFACSMSVEYYCIKNSRQQMERYWEYCTKLKGILADANIHSQEDIAEIKARLEKQIQDMRAGRQTTNSLLGKIGEIIAVPVILSIISTYIGKMDQIGEMVETIMGILLIAGALLATLLLFFNLFRLQRKRKMEQMIAFCDDLQGVLDLERFGTDVHNRNSDEK